MWACEYGCPETGFHSLRIFLSGDDLTTWLGEEESFVGRIRRVEEGQVIGP